jgi:hypothetical protein
MHQSLHKNVGNRHKISFTPLCKHGFHHTDFLNSITSDLVCQILPKGIKEHKKYKFKFLLS